MFGFIKLERVRMGLWEEKVGFMEGELGMKNLGGEIKVIFLGSVYLILLG